MIKKCSQHPRNLRCCQASTVANGFTLLMSNTCSMQLQNGCRRRTLKWFPYIRGTNLWAEHSATFCFVTCSLPLTLGGQPDIHVMNGFSTLHMLQTSIPKFCYNFCNSSLTLKWPWPPIASDFFCLPNQNKIWVKIVSMFQNYKWHSLNAIYL